MRNNNNNIFVQTNDLLFSVLWVNACKSGLRILNELNHLMEHGNNKNLIEVINKFHQVVHELALFKQDMGERKYDDKIYELIAHTIPESGLEADLENIEDGLSGDGIMPYYGLVPRSHIGWGDITPPLRGLFYLWSIPIFTKKNQIMVNYCIQIIIDIINCMRFGADKLNYYKKYYCNTKNVPSNGYSDYLRVVCVDLYQLMFIGATGEADNAISLFLQIDDLLFRWLSDNIQISNLIKEFTLEQLGKYYLNKYPGLQQQFDDPLEYFSPFNIDVLVFILFANVPNTVKYHQLLEIRAGLKKAFELKQTYPIELMGDISGECQTGTILNTPRLLDYVKKSHQYRSPTCGQQDMETKYGEDIKRIKIRGEQDVIFQQICSIYIKILEHPFVLLEEIYHQARHKRAEVLNGEKYEDIDIYMELTKLG